jgi:FkbM family methyltransferase
VRFIGNGLQRIGEYISALGIVRGLGTFTKVYFARRGFAIQMPGYPHAVVTRKNPSDRLVFEQIFIRSEYDSPFLDFEPNVIVDVGANIGLSTAYFAHRFPNAKIWAIEPDQGNFDTLSVNSAPYPNVSILRAGVWSSKGRLSIANPNHDSWAFRTMEATDESNSIPAVSMNDIVGWAGDRIDLLKMDIEGAEKVVFEAGDRAWIESVGAIVIELHDWIVPGSSMALYRAIENFRYDQFVKDENLFIVLHGAKS